MSEFRDALTTAVRGAICGYLNDDGPYRGPWFDNLYGPDGVLAPSGAFRRAAIGGGIALFCDSPVLPVPSPVTGGNCPGTYYRVNVTAQCFYSGENLNYEVSYASIQQRNQDTATGPIGGLNVPMPLVGGLFGFGPALTGFDGSSDGVYSLIPFGNDQGNRRDFNQGNNQVLSGQITSVVAISGPDDCGDAVPRMPLPSLPDRTFPIAVGVNTGIIQIGAGNIAVNGDVIIPVRIELPDLVFAGEVELFGVDFNFNLNPDLEIGLNPELEVGLNPDFDFGGGDPPDEIDPPDAEPPGKRGIIGVIVTTTTITPVVISTRIPQLINPDIYAPSIGYVNFRYLVKGEYVWSEDIPVKNSRQYIPCPVSFAAVSVQGTPKLGIDWTLTPVYALVKKVEFL